MSPRVRLSEGTKLNSITEGTSSHYLTNPDFSKYYIYGCHPVTLS